MWNSDFAHRHHADWSMGKLVITKTINTPTKIIFLLLTLSIVCHSSSLYNPYVHTNCGWFLECSRPNSDASWSPYGRCFPQIFGRIRRLREEVVLFLKNLDTYLVCLDIRDTPSVGNYVQRPFNSLALMLDVKCYPTSNMCYYTIHLDYYYYALLWHKLGDWLLMTCSFFTNKLVIMPFFLNGGNYFHVFYLKPSFIIKGWYYQLAH